MKPIGGSRRDPDARVPLALSLPLVAAALPSALAHWGVPFGNWHDPAWWLWSGGYFLGSFALGAVAHRRHGATGAVLRGLAWGGAAAAWAGLDVPLATLWPGEAAPLAGAAAAAARGATVIGQAALTGGALALLQPGGEPAPLAPPPRASRHAPPPPPAPPRLAYRTAPAARSMESIIVEELWNLPLEEAERSLSVLVAPPGRQMADAELPQLSQEQIRERVRGLLVHDAPRSAAPAAPAPPRARTTVAEPAYLPREPEPGHGAPPDEPIPAGAPLPPEPPPEVPSEPAAPPPPQVEPEPEPPQAAAPEAAPPPPAADPWGLEPAAPTPSPQKALAQAVGAAPPAPAASPGGDFFAADELPLQWGELETAAEPDVVEAYTAPEAAQAEAHKSALQEAPSDYWGTFSVASEERPEAAPAPAAPEGPAPVYSWGELRPEDMLQGQEAPRPASAGPRWPRWTPEPEGPPPYDLTSMQTELPRPMRLAPHRVRAFRPDLAPVAGGPLADEPAEMWQNVPLAPQAEEGAPVPSTLPEAPLGFVKDRTRREARPAAPAPRPTGGSGPLPEAAAPVQGEPLTLAYLDDEEGSPAPAPARLRWGLLLVPLLLLSAGGAGYAYVQLYQPATTQVSALQNQLTALKAQIQPTPGPVATPGPETYAILSQIKEFNLIGDPDFLFTSDKRVSEQLARLHRYAISHGAQLTTVEVVQVGSAAAPAGPTPAPTPSAVQVGQKEPATGASVAGTDKKILPGQSVQSLEKTIAGATPAPAASAGPGSGLNLLKREVHVTVLGNYRALMSVSDYLYKQPFPAHVQELALNPVGAPGTEEAGPGGKPKANAGLALKMTLAYYFIYIGEPIK